MGTPDAGRDEGRPAAEGIAPRRGRAVPCIMGSARRLRGADWFYSFIPFYSFWGRNNKTSVFYGVKRHYSIIPIIPFTFISLSITLILLVI